ncbi:MAG: hypothetical protein H0T73_17085 [Ardenticatenales bacterium]|nr:hypothetical protein [Ardenticatenales bacterium]
MRPSPTKQPISERDSELLLEELCIALRNVGVHDWYLPDGERIVQDIEEVKGIYTELERRDSPVIPRITRLSEETTWQMEILLEECLSYPQRMPYVREKDGIRRRFRCHVCGKGERPLDDEEFWMCDGCIREVIDAIRVCTPIKGIVLLRTYNEDKRCLHADADTVLAYYDNYDYEWCGGWCEECLLEAQAWRKKTLAIKE